MRRASTASAPTNVKELGNYGYIESSRNLMGFSDPDGAVTSKPTTAAKKSSFFGFSLDFNEEVENTKHEIEAKSSLAPQEIRKQVVREQKKSAAEQVVNDDEQWKKFQEQMRNGKGRTGMQVKENIHNLLQTTEISNGTHGSSSAAVAPSRQNRRASLTDFASHLLRGDTTKRPTTSDASVPSQHCGRSGKAYLENSQSSLTTEQFPLSNLKEFHGSNPSDMFADRRR